MRYRHAWPGFLLLTALVVLLASLVLWGDHLLTPSPAGGIRQLLDLWPASGTPPLVSRLSAAEVAAARPADPGDASPPASDPPEEPPPREAPRPEGVPAPAASPPPDRPGRPALSRARYMLDLGTFAVDEDAERAEAHLNRAGFSTVRFRQQAQARLFTVSVRPARDPKGAGTTLEPPMRAKGPGTAAGLEESVRIAQALPLRSAVRLAEGFRAAGYAVRILAEAARAGEITLRHGNFASRQEAESVGRELSRLGVPNEVVQVP